MKTTKQVFCKGITSNIEIVEVANSDNKGITGVVTTGVHKGKIVYVSNENIIKGKIKKFYTGATNNTNNTRFLEVTFSSNDLLFAWETFINENSGSIFEYEEDDKYIVYALYPIDFIEEKENLIYNYNLFKKMIK